jgi:membrane-associated phospholipid phosphatase
MQDLLEASAVQIRRTISPRAAWWHPRRSEWVIAAFLVYAAGLALYLPVGAAVRGRILMVNFAVLLVYAALIRFDRAGSRALSIVRDWLPPALVLLAYREMGWFAAPHHGHTLESHWIMWDRLVLRGGAKAAIEAAGPLLPSILEIAYALVYALPLFALAMLYIYRKRVQADRFLFIFTLGVLLCYAQFPFWPSEPPRVVFFGQDFPLYDTVFRRFNLWMLGSYGIHTSVFPSAHVAGAFSTAFGVWRVLRSPKWVSRFLYIMAALIAIATVYGRYHYMADATAGLSVAVFVVVLDLMALRRAAYTSEPATAAQMAGTPVWRTYRAPIPGLHSAQEEMEKAPIRYRAATAPETCGRT